MVYKSGVGKAYGFFGSNNPKNAVEKELYDACGAFGIHTEGLRLTEGMDNVRGDPGLTGIANKAKGKGINYLLEMEGPGMDNEKTAGMVADILNRAYMSDTLGDMKTFERAIVFERDGDYVFRD